ncbi:MAG: ATP-binding protein [Deltaproteobacteria bacterium]|nr:ATP-binding protein [Deltaproteobacteria bacterium]
MLGEPKAEEEETNTTAQQRAERRIGRLNRLLEGLRSVHQLIIRERDPQQLVQGVCKLLVESRGYLSAWILLSEGPFGPALTVEEGVGADFADLGGCLREGDLPACCLEALKAPGEMVHESLVCDDCPLCADRGPKGVMTAHLQHEKRKFGFLCVSTLDPRLQLPREHEVFQEVAEDVSFALHRLVLERERNQAVARRIALARKVQATQEQERARLSRELHDELGQILTALHFELDMLLHFELDMLGQPTSTKSLADANSSTESDRLADTESLADGLDKANAMVKDALSELRRICRGLRPMVLDDLGLVPAIKSLVSEAEQRLGLAINWAAEVSEEGREISPELAVCVFRVTQEALNNVARHANAERIRVALTETIDKITLEVEDDGCGFAMEEGAKGGGVGLQGMRERTDLVEGTLEISSYPGEGTLIRLQVGKESSMGGD